MDESRVVLAEYLRIDTRPTARRHEDESRCRGSPWEDQSHSADGRKVKERKRTGGYGHKKIGKTRSLDRAEERERVRHRVVDLW